MAGCGPKSSSPVVPEREDECRLSADGAESLDTFTVSLPDSVDLERAPIPTNESERLLFRQLFETLVRVDCQGELRPGLAAEWSGDSARRTWTFTLRDGARFAGGTAVTAARVVASWQSRRDALDALGIDSAVVLGDRSLAVTLRDLRDSIPRLFAEPALAVTPAEPISTTFVGVDGPYGSDRPVLDFQMAPGSDPRDVLDRGADLVITRDPALVDYAASRKEFSIFPLPWTRVYVLLQPAGAGPIEANISEDPVRRSLARDAVQAEARPAEPPSWWNGPCTTRSSMSGVSPQSPRIVYPRSDEVARGLAERVVALASGGTQLRAAGLARMEFADALRNGDDLGYIVALPRQAIAACRESAALAPGFTIYPLIDTRAHAIVRRGAPPLTVEWDGSVRVDQGGKRSQELQ